MKEYEMCWEIFNSCSGNQMRDVRFEDVATDDPRAYVLARFPKEPDIFEESVSASGDLIFDVVCSGLRQRVSFTEA